MNETELESSIDEGLVEPDLEASSESADVVAAPAEPEVEAPQAIDETSTPAPDTEEGVEGTPPVVDKTLPEGHVPVAKYVEERNHNKELQKRLDMMFEAMNKPQQPVEAPAAEPDKALINEVDREQDIIAYLERENEIRDTKLRQLEERLSGTQRQTDSATEQQQFMASLSTQEATFRETHSDYEQAIDHLRASESKKLMMYLDKAIDAGRAQPMTAEQKAAAVKAQVHANELQAAYQYAKTGFDPVSTMYDLALISGYTPNGSGEETPEASNIRKKAELQAEAQTLGAGGGELTRETVANGSNEEFMDAFKARFGK